MSNYNVNYTDIETTPIAMQEGTENNSTLDISIFGNTFLEYGQELNENILHLLENFSCPMNFGNLVGNATPDTHSGNGSYNKLLTKPTKGQIWYNSSLKKLYYWDGTAWRPISTKNDVAANWGIIAHGAQLPKPVSATTGYVFPYSECIWSVSPASFGGTFDYMACSTDAVATVNMRYRLAGSGTLTNGVANYLIIGIRGNTNHGVGFATTPPAASATPTATPVPISATPTPTASATPSISLSQTPIPSGTAQPTPTRTPTPTPSHTPTHAGATPTPTPSNSRPAVSASGTPPAPSASGTPPPTPTPSNSPVHPLTLSSYGPTSLSLGGSCQFAGAGHVCTATTTGAASVTPTGGIPPYTFQWQYFSGSSAFAIVNPTSDTTNFHANGTTPSPAGGHCDSCTNGEAGCPTPDGSNITCSVVRCKVTDSVGTIIFSPQFNLTFSFTNSS
jgi:hypothetical protein